MLSTIIQKFTRTSPPDLATNAELLASCSLPDPNAIRRELAMIEQQLAADDAAWERLDRTSNPSAFTEQSKIAERREPLLLQADAKKSQIAWAEKRHAALVALDEIFDVTDQQTAQVLQHLYADVLTASKDERRAHLESLEGLVRLRARVGAALANVSPLRKFRRAPDPFAALAHDLRVAADEIDRHHAPGMPRAPIVWPTGAQELIDTLTSKGVRA